MKKNIFIVAILVFAFSLSVNAQSKGKKSTSKELKWYSWEEGYEKAKAENKIMIVDVYTDWCHWCTVMDKKTYAKASVIEAIEEDFIAIKLNPEVKKKNGYNYNGTNYTGSKLIKHLSDGKFGGYPTTFFVFPKKKEAHMEVGYLEASVFKQKLEKYKAMKGISNSKGKK